jgi:hypothetical protein
MLKQFQALKTGGMCGMIKFLQPDDDQSIISHKYLTLRKEPLSRHKA